MNCSYSWGLARSVANIPSELHWRNWFFSCKQVSIAYIFLARSESSKGDSGIYGRIGRKIVRGDRWLQGNGAFQIQQVLRFYLWCTYALIEIAAACTGPAQFQARGPSTGRGKWSKRAQSDPLGLCFLLWENQTKVGCLPSSVWAQEAVFFLFLWNTGRVAYLDKQGQLWAEKNWKTLWSWQCVNAETPMLP